MLHRRATLVWRPTGAAAEVLCVDLRRGALLLTHLTGPRPAPGPGACRLQFVDADGIFQLSGTLAEPTQAAADAGGAELWFQVEAARHRNRRSAYRVGMTVKGQLAVFAREELAPASEGVPGGAQARLEELGRRVQDRKRPCIVLDLSLGGARVALPAPPPRAEQAALLDLALARGDVLHNIAATVVQGSRSGGRGEFPCHARLKFAPLSGEAESRLGRLVNRVQLEYLRRGVRDRP